MFDKCGFKDLLIKARGNRNNKEYADNSGVSRAYISGYINEKIEQPPSPSILRRLADVAYNGVTYADFMHYAGLESQPINSEKENRDFYKIYADDIEKALTSEEQRIFYILYRKISQNK